MLLIFLLQISCSDNSNHTERILVNCSIDKIKRLDSLKWFFYAYTYNDKLLFKKNSTNYFFEPIECDLSV